MRRRTAWFLSAALACSGCSKASRDDDNLDADITTNGCLVDPSKGADSALPLTLGAKTTGMLCPRGDQDFYTVAMPVGMNLLDVNLGYGIALNKVTLQARLFAADGATQIPLASASDTDSTDGKNAVVTTFAVPAPGTYLLQVGDATDAASDTVNSYVLTVAAALDPDSHESNDTPALAKPADGAPGYFAAVDDVDLYAIAIEKPGSLLQMVVNNPATAKGTIEYEIRDGVATVLGTGRVQPAAAPVDLTRPAPASGALFVSLRYEAGAAPDRRPEAGYTLALAEVPEADANDQPPRNDTPATATCLGGAGTPCPALFSGTAVTFKTQHGTIGSRGDRDYFMLRATSAPAVVQATLRAPATAIDLALDIVVPHLASPCNNDADCKVLKGACSEDDDCELSHHCIAAQAGACATASCRQCAGSALCLPLPDSPGQRACGVIVYTAHDVDGGGKTGTDGMNLVRTAQPLFDGGPYFLVVHDGQDDQYDAAAAYSLDVQVVPEPDPADNGATPAARNNYYNPYPIQSTRLGHSQARAKDITADIAAGTAVAGYLSYASDEDWFSFAHPCPGLDCGLIFEWVQPGASLVRPVFFMRTSDLTLHESWTYTGALPIAASLTSAFGDGDCTECSFASAKHVASGSTATYRYYLQVRDAGADDWDFSADGRYEFRLKSLTSGCPTACSEFATGTCGCFCKSLNRCPEGPSF